MRYTLGNISFLMSLSSVDRVSALKNPREELVPADERLRRVCRQYDAVMIEALFESAFKFPPGERRDQEIELVSNKVARALRMIRDGMDLVEDEAAAPPEVDRVMRRLEQLVERLDRMRHHDLN